MEQKYNIKKTVKQAIIFLIFTGVVMGVLLKGQDLRSVLAAAKAASTPLLVLGLILGSMFSIGEATNIKILLTSMGYRVTFGKALKYAFTGFFFSSITPSSTGGQPMQIYVMKKDRIEISHSSLALLIELASFQIVTLFFGAGAVLWSFQIQVPGIHVMRILTGIGVAINVVVILFLGNAIFSPRFSMWACKTGKKLICKLPLISQEKKIRIAHSIDDSFEEYRECAKVLKGQGKVLIQVLGVTFLQTICWFSVPFMVYLALGQRGASYLHVFGLQCLVHTASSIIPLPGAVGISEKSFLELFGSLYSTGMLSTAMLLSRGISFYFLLLLSFMVLVFMQVRLTRVEDKKCPRPKSISEAL